MHRVVVVAAATLFSIGMTSIASACCGWGYSAPITYAAVAPVGFGGCGFGFGVVSEIVCDDRIA